MRALFITHYFQTDIMVYNAHKGLQSAFMNRRFLNIIHKILQQWFIGCFREYARGYVETREPQTQGLSMNSIADSLNLNFLVYFAYMSSCFSMKTNKRKVRKYFKCVKEYSRRLNLANGKYLSIFLGFFARIVKITRLRILTGK